MIAIDDPRLTSPEGAFTRMQVSAGVAPLRKSPLPDGEVASQALHGQVVRVYREAGDFAHVQMEDDHYVGWAALDALSAPVLEPTHRVSALRTYMFSQPSLKSAPHFLISMNGQVTIEGEDGKYRKCARGGWVHEAHIVEIGVFEDDPASVAERFVGAPYLWGGCESLGLDCSGLIRAAFAACGAVLGRDSDMQREACGEWITDWQAQGVLIRGDLVFWDGHVGMMLDGAQIIHANAFHMACAIEPLPEAIARIAPRYGAPQGAKRIDLEAARRAPAEWMRG